MNDRLSLVMASVTTSWRRASLVVLLASAAGGCGSNDGPKGSACNLAAQTGCAAGEKCTYTCGVGGAVIACVPNGTLAVGDACPGADMCRARSFCAATAADPTASCRALCASNADCPSGTCMQLPLQFCGTDTTIGICG